MNATYVYHGSDGAVTRAYYAELSRLGPIGDIAVNLFRAQKCSTRAKVYRGGIRGRGSFRDMAYERKGWSLINLCKVLTDFKDAPFCPFFGWKVDPNQTYNKWVLYVDLPGFGQVSFHSAERYAGADYPSDWDGAHKSEERILAYCDYVMNLKEQGNGERDRTNQEASPEIRVHLSGGRHEAS